MILYQDGRSENKALHYRNSSDANGQSVKVSQENGQYTITNIDEDSTWRIDNGRKIYCTVDGRNYYLYRDSNNASLTPRESSALTWSIDGWSGGAVRFNTGSRSLRWHNNDFKIRNSEGTRDLYLYEKHSAPGGQAALTGTLSYTVKVGSSLTEAQIKEAASVLYREYAGAEEAELNWNEAAVSWNKTLNTNAVSVGRFSPFRVGLKTPISVNLKSPMHHVCY